MYINKYHGNYNIQKRTSSIKYIVIHYTGSGTSSAGSAKANCQYFSGGNRNASAHYFVDDGGIWEYADPSTYATWHCGDGHGAYGITNANSIGIEVCINGDKPYTAKEISYLRELVPYLMSKYKISTSNVVRHYDASRKQCPLYYAKRNNEWYSLRAKITSIKNGWIKENNEWYYYKNGTKSTNTWIKDSKGWCWVGSDGKWVKNKWIKYNNKWYYLKTDGYMAANEWTKDSTGWMWMDSSGKITKDKWIQYKNKWYYLKSNGYMAESEWTKYKNEWYYLKSTGEMTASEWLKYNNEWYYLKSNGVMAIGELTISGKTYKFDSSGKWLN